MLNIVSLSSSNGNGKVVDEKEGDLIKLTLIVKSNKDGLIEVISSQSEPYKLELLEVKKEEKPKIVKTKKIKYNPLTGVILNKINNEFNDVSVTETSVYLGIRLNANHKYDLLITPLSKNKVKIDMPMVFLDLLKIPYQTNNVFSYLGHLKIDKLREFTILLNNYKDYLAMD